MPSGRQSGIRLLRSPLLRRPPLRPRARPAPWFTEREGTTAWRRRASQAAIPLRRNGIGTDGLERSPKSDGKHTGKPGGPWVKQNGGAHRGKPSIWRELFKKGGLKANAQGKVYVGHAWTIDLSPWS